MSSFVDKTMCPESSDLSYRNEKDFHVERKKKKKKKIKNVECIKTNEKLVSDCSQYSAHDKNMNEEDLNDNNPVQYLCKDSEDLEINSKVKMQKKHKRKRDDGHEKKATGSQDILTPEWKTADSAIKSCSSEAEQKKKKKKTKRHPDSLVSKNNCNISSSDSFPKVIITNEMDEVEQDKSCRQDRSSEENKDSLPVGVNEEVPTSTHCSTILPVTDQDIEMDLKGKISECRTFEDMRHVLSAPTMAAIDSLGFTEMTEIQARAIPALLEGKDLRGTAKTGSGKTLAFLIPAFELLHRLEFQQHHGTGVIILCPTRELAMQTFGVTQILGDRHNLSYGLLIGGANRAAESKALKQGVNVVVACPGRMLDHLKNTSGFLYSNLVCLILDEADRMLSIGFEEEMKAILKLVPKRRQTMLFSATRNERTDNLTNIALKVTLVDVDLMAEKSHATVDQLNQYYLVCPVEQRFLVLYTFLKRKKDKKIMVFFSSCGAVKFYQELLAFIDMRVLSIHGKQKQTKRTESFMEFNASASGALLCTNVAARGWDIPSVDWIIQYDPPEDVNEYIHRVGRTARGGREGQALLILSEAEVGFVRCLRQRKINVEPIQIGQGKIYNIQSQLEKIMNERYLLALSGRAAYKDYLYSYMKHSQKDIFNYNKLDHAKVAKSFGFDRPPVIDLIAALKKNKKESYQQRNKKIRRS